MDSQKPAKRMGRPPKYAPGKRPTITFRVLEDLHRQLREHAVASGRSISEEVERRVEASFQPDATVLEQVSAYFGSDDAIKLLKLLAEPINYVLLHNNKSWQNDEETRNEILKNIEALFEAMKDGEAFAARRAAHEQRAAYERRVLSQATEGEYVTPPAGYLLAPLPKASSAASIPAGSTTLEATIENAVVRALKRVLPRSLTNSGSALDQDSRTES